MFRITKRFLSLQAELKGKTRESLPKSIFYDTYNNPVETARTLYPELYYKKKYFNMEINNIFTNNWFAVGHISEFKPFTSKSYDIGNESYIVTCDRNNNFKAFYNVCKHKGYKLMASFDTKHENPQITCGYHHFCYKLNGELKGQPYLDKNNDSLYCDSNNRQKFNLNEVDLDIYNGIIFLKSKCDDISINTEYDNIRDKFDGKLNDGLIEYTFNEYEYISELNWPNINANWKTVTDNYLEWFHIPSVHNTGLTYNSEIDNHYHWGFGRYWSAFITDPCSSNGSPIDLELFNVNKNVLPKHDKRMFMFLLYPNTIVSIHPTHAYIQFHYPLNKEKTHQKWVILQHPSSKLNDDVSNIELYNNKMNNIKDYWESVNNEDILAIERQQAGIKSKGFKNGGYYSSKMEMHVHHFHKCVIDSLT